MLKDLGKREHINLFIDFYYPIQVKDSRANIHERNANVKIKIKQYFFKKSLLEPETEHFPGVLLDFHSQWAQEIYWIVIFRKDQSILIANTEKAGFQYKGNKKIGLIVSIKLDLEAMHNGSFPGSPSFHHCLVLCIEKMVVVMQMPEVKP